MPSACDLSSVAMDSLCRDEAGTSALSDLLETVPGFLFLRQSGVTSVCVLCQLISPSEPQAENTVLLIPREKRDSSPKKKRH